MFSETRARGYAGYMALIGPTRPAEGRMMKILRKAGGFQVTEPMTIVCGESPRGAN
jgi:hypothetical protein